MLSALVPASWRPAINRCLKPLPAWMHFPLEVDRFEAFIILVVTVLTIQFNLVVAVGTGLVLAAVRFAWASSTETRVRVVSQSAESKRCERPV